MTSKRRQIRYENTNMSKRFQRMLSINEDEMYKQQQRQRRQRAEQGEPRLPRGGREYAIVFDAKLIGRVRSKSDNFMEQLNVDVEEIMTHIIQHRFGLRVLDSQVEDDKDTATVTFDYNLQGTSDNIIRLVSAVVQNEIKFAYKGLKVASESLEELESL